MIVPDANLLVYAYNAGAAEHVMAAAWWSGLLNGAETVGIPWQCITAFVRITTNPRVFAAPFSLEESITHVDQWLASPVARPIGPGPGHWSILRAALVDGRATGPLASDASLAALAIEHGAVLHTQDLDFRRFPGVTFVLPLGR